MADNKHKTTFVVDIDTKKLNQNLKKTGDKLEETGQKGFTAFKAKMVAGIAAAGIAIKTFISGIQSALKAASEFQEANSKFGVVFQDISEASNLMRKNLILNYGLSKQAATELLAGTGDLLTGFGFAGKEALALSTKVQELAVDLASFTNAQGGAEAVSAALTKALLGERESLKTYGIAIRETDVQAKLLEKGLDKLTGTALQQAKAVATLEIAMTQSKNAIGDFSRTQDSAANVSRRVDAEMENLAGNLGRFFLPAATSVNSVLGDLIGKFNEMIDQKVSEKLEEERIGLNALVGAIIDASDNQEVRNKLVDDLQAEYPDFLKNIDAETLSNAQLVKQLKVVNTEMLNRIQLQAVSEEKENAFTRAVKALQAQRSALRKVNEVYNETVKEGADVTATLAEKIEAIRDAYSGGLVTEQIHEFTEGLSALGKTNAEAALKDYEEAQADYAIATQEGIDLTKELAELSEKFGISLLTVNEVQKENTAVLTKQKEAWVTIKEVMEDTMETEGELNDQIDEDIKEQIELIRARQKAESDAAKNSQKEIDQTANSYEDFSAAIGTALGSGLAGDEYKESLKAILGTTISFIQKTVLAAQVAAGARAVFGDFSGLLQIVAVQAIFETLKVAVASFATGVTDFKGGVAKVHKDETVFLPKGTDVANKRETRQMGGDSNQLLLTVVRELQKSNEIAMTKKVIVKRGDIVESYDRGAKDNLRK